MPGLKIEIFLGYIFYNLWVVYCQYFRSSKRIKTCHLAISCQSLLVSLGLKLSPSCARVFCHDVTCHKKESAWICFKTPGKKKKKTSQNDGLHSGKIKRNTGNKNRRICWITFTSWSSANPCGRKRPTPPSQKWTRNARQTWRSVPW